MFSDYNCRILDINKFDIIIADRSDSLSIELEKVKKDLSLLAKLGFHTFYCPIRHNEDISVLQTKRNLVRLNKLCKNAVPRDCGKLTVNFIPKIYLSADAPYINKISSLAVKNSNLIFVDLPIDVNPTHVPETLNKLLYTCKLIPIFSEFQLFVSLYDPIEIDKMLRIKGAAFQFNIRTAFEQQNIKIIRKILRNDNTVLLGTGCSHENLNIQDINRSMEKLKSEIGEQDFINIILKAKRFLS